MSSGCGWKPDTRGLTGIREVDKDCNESVSSSAPEQGERSEKCATYLPGILRRYRCEAKQGDFSTSASRRRKEVSTASPDQEGEGDERAWQPQRSRQHSSSGARRTA
jgi:hypothetical protein